MKNNSINNIFRAILLTTIVLIPGCTELNNESNEDFILATTTSMRDSGLLDIIIPLFEEKEQISIKVVAVGTGAALRLGETGDADILIVHAPNKEEEFILQGKGISRTTFAWNRFVLAGPHDMSNSSNMSSAFIDSLNTCFLSRGDGSGTHIKEQEIWENSGIDLVYDDQGIHPNNQNFYSIGNGMSVALNMADEMDCNTLSDMGTFVQRSTDLDLVATTFEDEFTINPYSIIRLSEQNTIASKLESFLLNDETQQSISEYEINGQKLFIAGQPNQLPSNNLSST